MEIKVLQGLNLETAGTRIKIKLDSPISKDILEKIKNIHPVFMDEYSMKEKEIIVNSKLPHLWVEIGKALNNLATRDWTPDYTEEYIFSEIIKNQINSMSTISVLHAAMQEGYEMTQFFFHEGRSTTGSGDRQFNRYYCIGCGKESQITCSFASSMDAHIAQKTQRDKWSTNLVIERLGIPCAKWQLIDSTEDVEKVWDSYTKPIVIKPVGLTGGNGVVTNINTLEEAKKAFDFADAATKSKARGAWQYKIMMQEQVEGEDYRVLVINGKFEIATKRIPAHVIGDGKSSIGQLIENTNNDPRRDIKIPTHILKPITIDESLIEFLQSQKLNLDYVPKKDEKVFVRKVASMSKGGITEDFTDKVHPQIRRICESLSETLHAFVLGVDILCKDISKPLTRENGIVIECNTMPEVYLNAFPIIGKQFNDIGKTFLKGMIQEGVTKKIVYLGFGLKGVQAYLKSSVDLFQTYGLYFQNQIIINDEVINSDIGLKEARESMKINRSLATLVFAYKTEAEVLEHGLGFEKIDLLVVSKDISEKTIKILRGYENLGLISRMEVL